MDGGRGPRINLLILLILSLVAPPLIMGLAPFAGGLDELEQSLRYQVLLLSLAVAVLALFKETRR